MRTVVTLGNFMLDLQPRDLRQALLKWEVFFLSPTSGRRKNKFKSWFLSTLSCSSLSGFSWPEKNPLAIQASVEEKGYGIVTCASHALSPALFAFLHSLQAFRRSNTARVARIRKKKNRLSYSLRSSTVYDVRAHVEIMDFSSGDADGDGETETCEKTGCSTVGTRAFALCLSGW